MQGTRTAALGSQCFFTLERETVVPPPRAEREEALRAGFRAKRRPRPRRRSSFAASAPPPGRLYRPRLGFEAPGPREEEGRRKGTSARGFYQEVGEAPHWGGRLGPWRWVHEKGPGGGAEFQGGDCTFNFAEDLSSNLTLPAPSPASPWLGAPADSTRLQPPGASPPRTTFP